MAIGSGDAIPGDLSETEGLRECVERNINPLLVLGGSRKGYYPFVDGGLKVISSTVLGSDLHH